MPDRDGVEETMRRLLLCARILEVTTVVTEQVPAVLGPTVDPLRGAVAPGSTVLEKTSFSCWGATGFQEAVIGAEALVVMGMETHVCVLQTVCQALLGGRRVMVPADAVCSQREKDRDAALALMAEYGADVVPYETLVFDWLQDSRHERFRSVSRAVRGLEP
jgi:nicotinamidase-related amidase